MRDRDARKRRRRNRAADARHHLERHTGGAERDRFFPAAPEDKRVAAFEPHDPASATRRANHQRVDLLLRQDVTALALADEESLRVPRVPQNAVVDEGVVQHEVRCPQRRDRLARQERGIAGAGAHERDVTASGL